MYNKKMVKIIITENESNQRLDKFLKKYFKNAPLSYIYKLLRKDVKINGRKVPPNTRVIQGDEITIYIREDKAEEFIRKKSWEAISGGASGRRLTIAYEDDHILIAEKPSGLLVHGTGEEKKNTLTNRVIEYLMETGEYCIRNAKTFVPASVNRLDRNTSGLVIFGKNYASVKCLNHMMREGGYIHKYYLTIVKGEIKVPLHLKDMMVKDESLNKVKVHRPSVRETDEINAEDAAKQGKKMETKIRPIEVKNGYTLAEAELITGRTHQIRAQLAAAGYPIIGDGKYGDQKVNNIIFEHYGLSSQYLHAYKLIFEGCINPLDYLSGFQVSSSLTPYLTTIRESMFPGYEI